jgi:hypothetical protein
MVTCPLNFVFLLACPIQCNLHDLNIKTVLESGGRSVGIVRLRTQTMEFILEDVYKKQCSWCIVASIFNVIWP